MKKGKSGSMKFLAMLLVFTILISMFSGITRVEAASILSIKYIRERVNTLSGPRETNRLLIYGSGFVNPKIKAGEVSEIPIPINAALSNSDMIVVDDQSALDSIEGKISTIMVLNNGTDAVVADGTVFDLTSIPTISNVSTNKVYIGDPLDIEGMFFSGINPSYDKLSIARTDYKLATAETAGIDAVITNNKIHIKNAKSPIQTGSSDIIITRNLNNNPRYQIESRLMNSITVVDKLQGIVIERVDPNSGARDANNTINIFGKVDGDTYYSNFNSSMRVFINSTNGPEGVNKGVIKNMAGKVIGLSVQLPKYNMAGAVNLVLTSGDLSSELIIPNGFIYLDIGNNLTIEPDGINPAYKKETEDKEITITGRNIGYFDAANYDNLSSSGTPDLVGYAPITAIPEANNTTSYKVRYTGLYGTEPVTIIRQINVFIDGDAKILDTTGKRPSITKSKDTLIVYPADVNLDPNQPKDVDVTIKTTTVVYKTSRPSDPYYYSRKEEYTRVKGFQYIPDEIAPTITSITPDSGPSDKNLLITIKGFNLQVMEKDGTILKPTVSIGGRAATNIQVYDSQNRLVDGKKLQLGTRITATLPGVTALTSGAVDVVVKNPSQGQFTLINGFTFKNPNPSRQMPKIISLKEPFADMRGGILTGESVLIMGENFDAALEGEHRVFITIGGEKAEIKGKVSADGKTVTVIPPPGLEAGKTKLQLINQDGSFDEVDFEYRRAVTNPKITKIAPEKGGKGTKLVIKGEDFVLPDKTTPYGDPRRKGSVVLLNGKELNAYNYNADGEITGDGTDIYYNSPDGTFDGEMVKVQDGTTIYVDIPDSFYSFNASKPNFLQIDPISLGDLTVEVLNPDGTKSKENVKFTYLKPASFPTIDSITPANGSIDGGTIVTIYGTNFKQEDLQVFFASEEAKEIQYINTTELRVKVPIYPYDLPAGKDKLAVPVMVMNYDGGSYVEENGFEYRIPGSRPIITSLSPERGNAAGGEQIIIRGRDLRRDPNDAGNVPKVYFNGIAVEEDDVQWLSNSNVSEILLVTSPPSKIDGPVDVVLVNYDSGSYTYKSFNYEVSKPVISSVIPGSISKQGGTKVQINGTGFKDGDLTKLLELPGNTTEMVQRHTASPKPARDQMDALVIFGDVTSGDKKAINTIVGVPYVDLGDLRVSYNNAGDTDPTTVNIKIAKTSTPNAPFKDLNMKVGASHLFIINGLADLNDANVGDEGVLVEVTPNQVIVTRRIAPYARWENNGLQVTAIAPAVGSIGTRKLYLQNTDGGTGSANITVLNPASNPQINYISPRNKVMLGDGTIANYVRENPTDREYYTYTPLSGGAFLTINGSDFRRNVKVYMDNRELEIVSRSLDDNQLIVKVPSGTQDDLDKLYRILVVNEDGASADSSTISKPHYIVYKLPQSNPIVEKVVPSTTSARGENTIKIIGDDFREGAKVLIDGVESTSVTLISYKELAVRVPLGLTPGKKLVQVMNPDYGFGEKKDALTIVSSPEITEVYDETKDRLLDPILLSIDGGQTIRLEGRDYLSGAKVILGGTLKSKGELKSGETGIKCYDINDAEMYIVGGVEGINVKVVDSRNLIFTTPKLTVGDVSIIVVNADGGVSNEINASYQKPYPDSPDDIEIEVVDSDTIKLEWNKVSGTKYYELYASASKYGINADNYVYVGSVAGDEVSEGRLRYYVDGLKANTYYSFKLKSVNSYGPSSFSYSTIFVKTKDKKITTYYQPQDNYESGIAQNDKVTILNNSLTFAVGEKSMIGSGAVVYFNQASYTFLNPKSLDIAMEILKDYPSKSIIINEKDFTLKLVGSNLLVSEAKALAPYLVSDSKMIVVVNKELKAKGDEIKLKVPKGYKAVTNPVAINVNMQVEKKITSIKTLNGNADISFNVSDEMKRRYPGGVYIAYYNNTKKTLDTVASVSNGNLLTAKTNKPGEYLLIGKLTK